jgi:GNAT superfamily N-acetyltransferase
LGRQAEEKHVIDIGIAKREALRPLFQTHIRQRVVIDALLEQPYGDAVADRETRPHIARLHLGAFTFFAGDPNHPLSEQLITSSPEGLLIAETDAWQARICSLLGKRCSTYLRRGFSHHKLDLAHVRGFAERVPPDYTAHRFNADFAAREYTGTAYTDPETLLARGIGFCAVSGHEIASVAAAYTNSRCGIEVQIYTHGPHRQKGLATCTSAALIAWCLENGVTPHWSAANAVSARLAEKLGYIQTHAYDAIVYRPEQ